MLKPTFLIAAIALAATAAIATAPIARAAPVRFEPVAFVVPLEPIAPVEQDTGRQGYVTAFRSPVTVSLVQGRGRPRRDPSFLAGSALAIPLGGWTMTTATATVSVFLPLAGGVPQVRPDASAQPMPVLASILNLRELGQLDGGAGAMRRVIDGQRISSETDPFALLMPTR